jgi:hypothetical protein
LSHGLILIDVLSSVCWEKNKKKKRREAVRLFFPRLELDMPCWLCQAGFSF